MLRRAQSFVCSGQEQRVSQTPPFNKKDRSHTDNRDFIAAVVEDVVDTEAGSVGVPPDEKKENLTRSRSETDEMAAWKC